MYVFKLLAVYLYHVFSTVSMIANFLQIKSHITNNYEIKLFMNFNNLIQLKPTLNLKSLPYEWFQIPTD